MIKKREWEKAEAICAGDECHGSQNCAALTVFARTPLFSFRDAVLGFDTIWSPYNAGYRGSASG